MQDAPGTVALLADHDGGETLVEGPGSKNGHPPVFDHSPDKCSPSAEPGGDDLDPPAGAAARQAWDAEARLAVGDHDGLIGKE